MTDRELLELAAKAAGIEITWEHGRDYPERVELFRGHLANYEPWDPLNLDGDAFRLVAQLGLDIEFGNEHVWCCIEDMENYVMHPLAGDRAAAARRVVVESAAAIQQAKEAK
ncbi:hypothetical protein [Comamonas sp. MYb396]|uniref:hypothetical protein n=1 Tax=Comamonas sp. MYb396 TaxID=2745302 RepID=UPI00309970D5